MDFEKFKESLIEDVQQGLYEKGIEANVSTNDVSKLNESYEALTVTPEGSNVGVNVNMENFFEAYEKEYLDRIRAFRQECEKRIGGADITICVENTAGYLSFQQKAVEMLLESPVFGLTFDIGHNYCSGGMDEDFILAHKERLKHFHIHDCQEGRKDHRTLGTGVLDVGRYLALAEALSCTAVVETKTLESLKTSMDWIRR